jgi:hypothetical protein
MGWVWGNVVDRIRAVVDVAAPVPSWHLEAIFHMQGQGYGGSYLVLKVVEGFLGGGSFACSADVKACWRILHHILW